MGALVAGDCDDNIETFKTLTYVKEFGMCRLTSTKATTLGELPRDGH